MYFEDFVMLALSSILTIALDRVYRRLRRAWR